MERFRTHPRQDDDVVSLLEKTLAAARLGQIRSIVIVISDPFAQVESEMGGDLTIFRRRALIGGLVDAGLNLMRPIWQSRP